MVRMNAHPTSLGGVMRYLTLGALLLIPIAFVMWPSSENEPASSLSLAPATDGFGLVIDKCRNEMREMASETGTPWDDGAANTYCMCVSAELLFRLESEDEVLETAKLITSDRELFRGFMRLESVVQACAK
jgi:hypothetical protein